MSSLDPEQIRQQFRGQFGELPKTRLESLEVFAEIESTNSYLMNQPAPPPGRFRVALAEHQTAGRGRMDRSWQSPALSGLCLSVSYTFSQTPSNFAVSTLATGVGIAEALQRLGVDGIGLKWPNDIILRDGKLGGILTEVHSSRNDALTIVVGVGINIDLRNPAGIEDLVPRIGYASDLATGMTEPPSRAVLSAAMIECIYNALVQFESAGFGVFRSSWERYDWLRGQMISVETENSTASGVCEGIDNDGALLLRTADGRKRILSGSVHRHDRNSR